MAAIVIVFVEQ